MNPKFNAACIGLLCLFVMLNFNAWCAPAGPREPIPGGYIHYVKPMAAGTGDGSSWENASSDLQAMISSGAPDVQVWVAAGTYKPTTGTDRSISFALASGIGLYGGFAGTETFLAERDLKQNVTILSGDIGIPGDNSDNSYHVIDNSPVTFTQFAILDGFTITGGNASANDAANASGGGIKNKGLILYISRCIFDGNSARTNGGAMDNYQCAVNMSGCFFVSNSCTDGHGGAISNNMGSSLVANCVFYTNAASLGGSAIQNIATGPSIVNCTFTGNIVEPSGSTIYNTAANPAIINCIIWESNSTGADPLFTNAADPDGADNIFGTNDDGLFINCGSPALNAGDNSNATGTDITGNTRIQFATVDNGAYETAVLVPLTWYYDTDHDGYYGTSLSSCDNPGTGWLLTNPGPLDCDDDNASLWRTALFYKDTDGDGYDDGLVNTCYGFGAPPGYLLVTQGTDCNDNDPDVWRNGVFYLDADHDGYGVPFNFCYGSDAPAGYITTVLGTDCDDNNPDVWRSDNLFIDSDGDGYENGVTMVCFGNTAPPGYAFSSLGFDCDDSNPAVWRGGTLYKDEDQDGYAGLLINGCYGNTAPDGYSLTTLGFDCDDHDAGIHPGVTEIENGKDDNCDGNVDEGVCHTPISLSATNITQTSVRFNWGAVYGARSYTIVIKKATTPNPWVQVNGIKGTASTFVLKGLTAATKYRWAIRTNCTNGASFFSPPQLFTSKPQGALQSSSTGEDAGLAVSVNIYPNPAVHNFTVALQAEDRTITTANIQLVNFLGQVIYTTATGVSGGRLQKEINTPMELTPSYYTVKVIMGTKLYTSKLIIQK